MNEIWSFGVRHCARSQTDSVTQPRYKMMMFRILSRLEILICYPTAYLWVSGSCNLIIDTAMFIVVVCADVKVVNGPGNRQSCFSSFYCPTFGHSFNLKRSMIN